MTSSEIIEIIPDGEDNQHTRGKWCTCNPIVEPGETPTVTHRSVTPGNNTTAVRRDG